MLGRRRLKGSLKVCVRADNNISLCRDLYFKKHAAPPVDKSVPSPPLHVYRSMHGHPEEQRPDVLTSVQQKVSLNVHSWSASVLLYLLKFFFLTPQHNFVVFLPFLLVFLCGSTPLDSADPAAMRRFHENSFTYGNNSLLNLPNNNNNGNFTS